MLLLAAGLALGTAATVRGVGVLLLAPAAVTALALGLPLGRRRAVQLLAALGVGFALRSPPTWSPSTSSMGRSP